MSVLKSRRKESKTEFVNVANQIFTETLGFVSRLSARYSRLLAKETVQIASNIIMNVMAANTMQPTDEVRYNERKAYLLRARGAVAALDYHLAQIYEVLMLNPEGAFSTRQGSLIPLDKAVERLDRMSQSLGEKIDEEDRLLNGVLKSDRQAFLKKQTK